MPGFITDTKEICPLTILNFLILSEAFSSE